MLGQRRRRRNHTSVQRRPNVFDVGPTLHTCFCLLVWGNIVGFLPKRGNPQAVADPECERGGGVSHILAEKGVLASLYSKRYENVIFSPRRGGGAYAGYALCWGP